MRGLPVSPLALLRNSANSAALDPRSRLYPRVPYVFLSCPIGVVKFSHDETADEAMNFGKPKIGDAVVESGPLVGKDGSGKDDRADGKLRWDLLPLAEIEDIVRVYTEGAKKYADNSWQNIPDGFERYRASLSVIFFMLLIFYRYK
jgi:hypothetical protein